MSQLIVPDDHFLFSSESVTEGHPDKMCDSFSDAILDACLEQDPNSKVACEAVTKSNMVLIVGELTTSAKINIEQIVRERIKEIGYDDEKKGINWRTCDIILKITRQSHDISQAVHENKKQEEIGAGDQGFMFGYATDETEEFFPFSHLMALRLSEKLTEVRKKKILPWLRPDGKTEVTVEYKKEGGRVIPVRILNILVSAQHDPEISNEEIREKIITNVINPVIPKEMIDSNIKIYVNPSGKFVIGGPESDTGLTGRKIIVDTYGGWGAHGGGAFSGKDPSKVDRSGAYMARWIAKSLVSGGLCQRVLVQITPISVYVDTYGTGANGKSDKEISEIVKENFDMKPGKIIKELKLTRPIFTKTANGGHFGRNDPDFTWEIPKEIKIN